MTENYTTEDYISVRQAAAQCGKNPETIRRWIWSGKLSARKLGNQLFIKKEALIGVCRETATVGYRAVPEIENREKDIERENIEDWLERAKALRDSMTASGVKLVNSAELIRKMRGERMDEIERNINKPLKEDVVKVEDFLVRSRAFRNMLRKRIGNVDSAGFVKKSREEREFELNSMR